jgi:hypothetical protein
MTFNRAVTTDFGALLAVIHLVFGALVLATFTNLGACLADDMGHFAFMSHIFSCQSAYRCAVHIQHDAVSQRRDIRLTQASLGAALASQCARMAGFDTGLELVVGHNDLHAKR